MARGIRANLVVPSLVDTPLGREASRLNPGRTARRLPFGRQATAWEVAYAAVWLLSGESSYVNAHPLDPRRRRDQLQITAEGPAEVRRGQEKRNTGPRAGKGRTAPAGIRYA